LSGWWTLASSAPYHHPHCSSTHRHTDRGTAISTDALARSVAIDGPTASGKSVVGRALAERLGLGFVDTGLMYRACTLAVLRTGTDARDAEAVTALVRALDLDMYWPEPSSPHVTLEGVDVTGELRTAEIERTVSLVSGIPAVRDELVRRQRALAERSPIVMAGRDIGTRVLTEARTKVFLEASAQVRANRRLREEIDSGRDTNFDRVLDETRQRDEADSTGHRAIRREQAAPDALIIDTDPLGRDEVVELCLEAYRAANGS
jgi:cytidylate kinase